MFDWFVLWFPLFFLLVKSSMNTLIVVNLAVAAGTIALAIAAFLSIRETRKILKEEKRNHVIEKSPILDMKLRLVDGNLTDYTDNKIRIDCQNVGYGPAFNVDIKCSQGGSAVRFEPQRQCFPLTLLVGAAFALECHWPFELENQEDKSEPLLIESTAESIFKTKVEQKFKLPISTQGAHAAASLEHIDLGVNVYCRSTKLSGRKLIEEFSLMHRH